VIATVPTEMLALKVPSLKPIVRVLYVAGGMTLLPSYLIKMLVEAIFPERSAV